MLCEDVAVVVVLTVEERLGDVEADDVGESDPLPDGLLVAVTEPDADGDAVALTEGEVEVEPLADGSVVAGGVHAGNLWVLSMSPTNEFGALPTTSTRVSPTTTPANDATTASAVAPTQTPSTLVVRTPPRQLVEANGTAP